MSYKPGSGCPNSLIKLFFFLDLQILLCYISDYKRCNISKFSILYIRSWRKDTKLKNVINRGEPGKMA